MDFSPAFLNPVLFKIPKGLNFTASSPGGNGTGNGLKWTNKYGYVGIGSIPKSVDMSKTPIPIQDIPVSDGMNTAGLSVATLWLAYTDIGTGSGAGDCPACLSMNYVMSCLLGTCADVNEVITKLSQSQVWVQPDMVNSYLIHLSIHDQSGKSLVVEYVNGEQKIYQNDDIGVVTNEPPFDWQTNNYNFFYSHLNNLNNLRDKYDPMLKGPSGIYAATSDNWQTEVIGSGLFGIPGDSTSPSRFARAAALRKTFPNQYDNHQGVQYALQLLGRVAVCDQEVIMADGSTNPTLWMVVRDHSQKIFYYASRMDHNLKAVKLNDLDFSDASLATYTMITDDQWFIDSTSKLKSLSQIKDYQINE